MKLHFHKYKIIRVEYIEKVNRDDNTPTGRGETLIYEKCRECGKVRYREIRGLWKIEELK